MENRLCFVIAPIGDLGSEIRQRSEDVLEYFIKPVVESVGYKVEQSDQIARPGNVSARVVQRVLNADLVIADLTFLNPNVMYELGIRHSFRKPAILISSDMRYVPFDVSGLRTIIFDINDISSVEKARAELLEIIDHIDREQDSNESPISLAAALEELQNRSNKPIHQEIPADTLVNILKDLTGRLKALEYLIGQSFKGQENAREYSRRIFIVHGHDGELKNELARLLERLDFEPIILHEQPDRGQTVFDKLSGEMGDVGFAFVILTPDDIGSVASKPDDIKPRARQNVVFEHGLFCGYLQPERVCAIRRGDVEFPSDLLGVLYKTVPLGGSIRSIALEIVHELRAAGYILDANKLFTI
jgi:predicted nucleotide-binding protein